MAMNGIEIALMIRRIDKDYHLIVWKLPYAQKFSGSGKVHSSAQGRRMERDYKRHGHLSPANDPFVHVLWGHLHSSCECRSFYWPSDKDS